MTKYLLYGHGGAYNHGAEAIVRTTVPLLRARCPDAKVLLSTHFPEQDREFGLDRLVDRLIPADMASVPKERKAGSFEEKEQIAGQIYREALTQIDKDTVCVGIGGDNYCYPNWHRQSLFHHTAKARGGRSVLWGCSIEPAAIDARMAEILRAHDHIYVRESLTAQALQEQGVRNLTLCPDPAFQLVPETVPLPEGFSGSVAALNLSPLALRRADGLMQTFVETARALLGRADRLLLLPHVSMPVDDDRGALCELERQLTPSERFRICRVPDQANAAQLKYLISCCKILVCCRTHASIAAYSTGVPVLVLGYSIKSAGIGRDLDMADWVLPLEKRERLPELSMLLWEKQDAVRSRIASRLQHMRLN